MDAFEQVAQEQIFHPLKFKIQSWVRIRNKSFRIHNRAHVRSPWKLRKLTNPQKCAGSERNLICICGGDLTEDGILTGRWHFNWKRLGSNLVEV